MLDAIVNIRNGFFLLADALWNIRYHCSVLFRGSNKRLNVWVNAVKSCPDRFDYLILFSYKIVCNFCWIINSGENIDKSVHLGNNIISWFSTCIHAVRNFICHTWKTVNDLVDIVCSFWTLFRKMTDFICNYSKSLTVLTGSCSFNWGIKRKKIGLGCDCVDFFKNWSNLRHLVHKLRHSSSGRANSFSHLRKSVLNNIYFVITGSDWCINFFKAGIKLFGKLIILIDFIGGILNSLSDRYSCIGCIINNAIHLGSSFIYLSCLFG